MGLAFDCGPALDNFSAAGEDGQYCAVNLFRAGDIGLGEFNLCRDVFLYCCELHDRNILALVGSIECEDLVRIGSGGDISVGCFVFFHVVPAEGQIQVKGCEAVFVGC